MPLSHAAQIAFDTWPGWALALDEPPTLIRPLSGGRSHQHYLVKAMGLRLVMRVSNSDQRRSGIDRRREQQVLQAIAGSGLAPAVFYCDPAKGVLVSEYVEGRHWRAEDVADVIRREALLELVGTIQALELSGPRFDYEAYVRSCWQHLLACEKPFPMSAKVLFRRLESQLAEFQSRIGAPVLCHHDLRSANIVECGDGRLLVLNWEYAGIGSAEIEAIALARYWRCPELEHLLLAEGEPDSGAATARDIVEFYDLVVSTLGN